LGDSRRGQDAFNNARSRLGQAGHQRGWRKSSARKPPMPLGRSYEVRPVNGGYDRDAAKRKNPGDGSLSDE
jgi:hypothetical protein